MKERIEPVYWDDRINGTEEYNSSWVPAEAWMTKGSFMCIADAVYL